MEQLNKIYTLREVIDRLRELNKQGYDTWIEGLGDGRFKINIEERKITIIK